LFFRGLVGRYISIENPLAGRYSRRKLKEIIKDIEQLLNELLLKAELSQYKSHGNRFMVFCSIVSLASYRALKDRGMSHQYATLLVSDVIWKLYIFGAKVVWIVTGFVSRNSHKRLNYTLRILCKYPFNPDPKGYQFSIFTSQDCITTNFTQCVAHKYFSHTGNEEEMDFFRNSWCKYDFALPSYLIEGGRYEREHTLSSGDGICDMKWYAKSKTE